MRNFLPRDWKFSFSVLQFWSNHFICDFHLILLPLALLRPTSLHVSTKVSLSNSDAVSMLSCLTAAINLNWTVYINSDMSSPTGPTRKHMPALSLILLLLKIFLTTLLSGESTRLPPMWPMFKSRRRRHMWVEFVVGSLLCSERFFFWYSGFSLSSKTNTSKFLFDLERTHTLKRVHMNS